MSPTGKIVNVKDHYDRHLGNLYSWMTGDFANKQAEQQQILADNGVVPTATKIAVDLGAAHGLQAVSLARLGFHVIAVDFNKQLLVELEENRKQLPIKIIECDIRDYFTRQNQKVDVIVCMGDTLTHLDSTMAVAQLIRSSSNHLVAGGKLVLSFRDLSQNMEGTQRFIPVRSDDARILTCFLEYFKDYVMVYDILQERVDGSWIQKISAYPKLKLNEAIVSSLLAENNMRLVKSFTINRMLYMIAENSFANP
jgi:2-polyprenyl-3-methyl-5-hydroxy-6-metoxy-1,4-benzoquinol methylase